MPTVANKKTPVLSDTRAKKRVAVASADCDSFQPAVQALCPRCALFIPKRSQHGKNVCRWTGEVLTAATMPLFCCGYTVEVVHG